MINRIIIFCTCIMTISSCSESNTKDTTTRIKPVKYVTVRSTDVNESQSFTGLAKSQREAQLSFKVSGTLNAVKVKVGEKVQKGQILAVLDASDYQVSYNASLAGIDNSKAQVENAQAQLENARSALVTAESNYKRYEKLYETNSISISEFEQAKSSCKSAQANYKAVNTQIAAAQSALRSSQSQTKSASNQVSYTRMTAPFSGIITEINIEPNELAAQGQPIMVINSEGKPDIEVGIPEKNIASVKPNQEVIVTFNTLKDVQLKGAVHEIGYNAIGNTYPVTVRMKENDARIRPGMPAIAKFIFSDQEENGESILVPSSAIGEDNQGRYVYIISEDKDEYICKRRAVKVGKVHDANFEVLDGLSGGEMIVSAGLNMLQDGMLVSLYHSK